MTTWEPTTHKGKPARLYPDGSVRNARGHWLARHPGADAALRQRAEEVSRNGKNHADIRNTGDALAILRAENQTERKRLAREQAEAGLLRSVQKYKPGSASVPAEAWGVVMERQTDVAISGKPGSVTAAELVGRSTGYLVKEQQQPAQPVNVNVVQMDADTWQLLADRKRLGDVVDGESREVDAVEESVPPTTSGS